MIKEFFIDFDFSGWTIIKAETEKEAIEQFYDTMCSYNELGIEDITVKDIVKEG